MSFAQAYQQKMWVTCVNDWVIVYFDCSAILFVLQKWVDVNEEAVCEMFRAWRDVSRWFCLLCDKYGR